MMTEKFLIAGNDAKMTACKDYLISLGYIAKNCIKEEFWSEFSQYNNIILPLPTIKDSVLSGAGKNIDYMLKKIKCNQRIFFGNLNDNPFGKNGFCYYRDAEFLKYNSKLTAQGVLKIILDNIQTDLSDLKVAVIGYGNCGEAICKMLISNSVDVTVFSRSPSSKIKCESIGCNWYSTSQTENIKNYDIIINTVPVNIISKDIVKNLNNENMFIETASKPFGFDIDSVDLTKFRYINANSLPGRFTPVAAGKNIAKTVIRILEEGKYG